MSFEENPGVISKIKSFFGGKDKKNIQSSPLSTSRLANEVDNPPVILLLCRLCEERLLISLN
jgi:hypothetical protein